MIGATPEVGAGGNFLFEALGNPSYAPAMRALVVLLASLFVACGTPSSSDAGAGGGGSATGGGAATGGGSTGGGAATGGGSATGGGNATGGGGGGAPDAGMDAGQPDSGVPDAGLQPCTFTPTPADGTRRVVVSHPFPGDGGSRDNLWELFTLDATGALTANGVFFRMGRSSDGSSPIVFTADGRYGFAAQEDGTIGVFRLDGPAVTVLNARFTGTFSAGKLVMQPSGNRLWVLDFNTENNGGGVYTLGIACDGTLFNEQYAMPGNNAAAATLLRTAGQLAVAARSLPGTPMMQDVHLVNAATSAVLTSTTGFPDRDAIAPTLTASRDERFLAMPDNGFGVGSRVAFFERTGTTLTARQVVTTNVTNPIAVHFSPFTDSALVVNTDGADHFRRATWNAAGTSFSVSAPLTYVHGRPQLPSAPVMIDRGTLEGRLLIAELDAVRQLQFERDGGITDVSSTPAGLTGNAQILGTIGVTP